jgi:hypothetical protein
VAANPDIRARKYSSDVAVYLLSGVVVPVLFAQSICYAGGVASKGAGLAIAYLVPTVPTALAAAAGEEEVIVNFVVCGRA